MISKKIISALISATAILFLGTSCDRTRNDKGYEYFPDMAHSLTYETYAKIPAMSDSSAMRLPVANTISREVMPYAYPATIEGRAQAAAELVNPLEVNADNLNRGKELFTTFCIGCHGEKGNGEGHLFTSGRYAIKPASLISDKMMSAPEGDIYHVISVGYNVMGAHGHMIRPDDRWKIAMFVKNELQSKPVK
ncbi:MAG: c-type cytochrome [Lentimicrobiaceae bacterium]|nr:c-type cytochrome [Lentimicrobiaceae bacterium]MCO5265884.1 c-type cytochrome [Lentimicrobium sp.]